LDIGKGKALRNGKGFIKIEGLWAAVFDDLIDYQTFRFFGMWFGVDGGNIINIMKEEPDGRVVVRVATLADIKYVYPILKEMEASARVRGTGIAKRTPQSLCWKIYQGKAVIAVSDEGDWAGFSYIEVWGDGEFVSNSGLIVNPPYRNAGVATAVKRQVFALAKSLYPAAKIFSITTGAAIMKMNIRLGFEPVVYADITQDERFWEGCKGCVNYPILQAQGRKRCLCTAMLCNPEKEIDPIGREVYRS
jgi:GNAT superfamily N-acetyltransferase